ncbi:hypothetical protein ACQP04_12975 [Pseudonocardia halophobica]|uniref:hypothetical protein n=1 Tax=Pseudonocardia halophobica TaxID=29401 RepID=UPI003D8F1FFF
MALSRLAAEFAAEIKNHDWSDAPYRADRAGHQRAFDGNNPTIPQLGPRETEILELNVMWVAAQVLAHRDPNFDVYEFAEACGIAPRLIYTSRGRKSGGIINGLRQDDGGFHRPGTYSSAPTAPVSAAT